MPEIWCAFLHKLPKVMYLQINNFECEFYNYGITTLIVISHKYHVSYNVICNYGNHLQCDHHVIQTANIILLLKFSDMVKTANK